MMNEGGGQTYTGGDGPLDNLETHSILNIFPGKPSNANLAMTKVWSKHVSFMVSPLLI